MAKGKPDDIKRENMKKSGIQSGSSDVSKLMFKPQKNSIKSSICRLFKEIAPCNIKISRNLVFCVASTNLKSKLYKKF